MQDKGDNMKKIVVSMFLFIVGLCIAGCVDNSIFLCEYETFRFKHLRRLTKDSNLLSWGFEPLVLMGLEPMGDNGRSILSFVV